MPAPLRPPEDLTDPAAPSLFSGEILQEITRGEEFGRYTLERLPQEKRDAIRVLAGQDGWTVALISRTLHVSRDVVSAVLDTDQVEIVEYRARLPRRLRRVLWHMAGKVEQDLEGIPAKDLAPLMKVFYEMEATESGRPSSITERRQANIFATWDDYVRSLEAQASGDPILQKRPAVETHLAGGNNLLQDSGGQDPGPRPESPAKATVIPETDLESEHSAPIPQAAAVDVTTFATDSGTDRHEIQTPGTGEAEPPRGGDGRPRMRPGRPTG